MNNDDKNNFNKRVRNIQDNLNNKKQKSIIILDDEFDNMLNELDTTPLKEVNNNIVKEKEFIKIEKKIDTINDLIELGKLYDDTKSYSLDLKILNKLVVPLEELNNMIGMKRVKVDIVDHILFNIQKLDDKNKDMLHTVIEGPPGVGKTELGKILGKIYLAMGVLKNNIFKKVSRSDMVAKYLGQTAIKTDELIDSCRGGVMFIDEVYSLGNKHLFDSFSKEAIDTLNQKLSELKNEFICIVAGYPREISECFFAYNQGLNSRFPIRFTIDPYTPKELLKIFTKVVIEGGWSLDSSVKSSFFKKNYTSFKYYGRDIENFFTKCKRAHSKRLFIEPESQKKLLTISDIIIGFRNFQLHKS